MSTSAAEAGQQPAEAEFRLFTTLRFDPKLRQVHGNPAFGHAGYNHAHATACYMLDFHRDRIARAARYWKWDAVTAAVAGAEGLELLDRSVASFLKTETATADDDDEKKESKPWRVRVLLYANATLRFEHSPEADRPLRWLFPAELTHMAPESDRDDEPGWPVYTVLVDGAETGASAFTHYKTTKREMYDGARQRAGIQFGEAKEVLLVNDVDGSVMEGSVSTPYFWRGGRWVTPPVPTVFAEDGGGSGGQDGTTRRWALENKLAVEETVKASGLVDGEPVWMSNGAKGFMFGILKKNS